MNPDTRYPLEQSLVLRYHRVNRLGLTLDELKKVSCYQESAGEGCRLLPLLSYKGIQIDIWDESSLMSSGTMKAVDACLAVADACKNGRNTLVVPSGANTGSAYALYSQRAGLETYVLVPLQNCGLLDYRLFEHANVHLIGVEDPAILKQAMQQCADLLAQRDGLSYSPSGLNLNLRLEASRLRGYALAEQLSQQAQAYTWIVQSVMGAFGPMGIYQAFEELKEQIGQVLPRFLGIQQAATGELYAKWKQVSCAEHEAAEPLNPVMYDVHPLRNPVYASNAESLLQLLARSQGDLLLLTKAQFQARLSAKEPALMQKLEEAGVPITLRAGEAVEVAGLMGLCGILEAIDQGTIRQGPVLCLFTGGVSRASSAHCAVPEFILPQHDPGLASLQHYLAR